MQLQVNKGITAAALPTISGNVSYTNYVDIPTQTISDFISPLVYGVLNTETVKNGTTGNTITAPGNYGTIAAQFSTRHNANAGIELQQLLFVGQVFAGLKARNTSIANQEMNAEVTMENIEFNHYKNY